MIMIESKVALSVKCNMAKYPPKLSSSAHHPKTKNVDSNGSARSSMDALMQREHRQFLFPNTAPRSACILPLSSTDH